MASIETNYSLVQAFFGTNTTSATQTYGSTSSASSTGSYASNTAALASNSDISSYLTSVKGGAKTLLDSLNSLLAKTNSAFDQKSAASSNADVVAIKSGTIKTSNKYADEVYKIDVDQLAQTQKNIGDTLSSTAKSFDADRYYGYSIETNGKTYDFSFSVNENESNDDVLKRMAKDINDRGIGVTATVSYDAFNKKSSLVLESDKSGLSGNSTADAFTVTSRTGYADAAAIAGIKDVDQKAQNALYRINDGEQLSSQSNDIALSNGATVTAKAVGTANISSEKNSLNALNATREMVNGFNKLLEAANSLKDSDSGAKRLYDTLAGLVETYSKSLSDIGISANENGYLSIDEDKMKTAGADGTLEKFFKDNANTSYGFANRLAKLAGSANSDATTFLGVNAKETMKVGESTALTDSKGISYSSFQITNMAKYNNVGMLFDSMF